MSEALITLLQNQFGADTSITILHGVHGGCIGQSYHVQINGEEYFIKTSGAVAPAGIFQKEAKGLQLLKQYGLQFVPEVALVTDEFLLLKWIETGKKNTGVMQRAGENLARLHRQAFPYFGLEDDNYIGSLVQQNTVSSYWPEFYYQHRLMYMGRIALERKGIYPFIMQDIERLYTKLPEILPDEPPSLLHGDLWGGNFMASADGKPYFIDPAVYGGHREVDLAMTMLFGGFDTPFYEAYNHHYPVLPDFRERIAIYELYPLLVHAAIFGMQYANDCARCLRQYL
ncbi:MAG: fructosamine kinase family protein [Chitinophagales bacterium]|nr:fructosamine kinase family protein [Chitinophagales bacterium]